jgi:type 1 glutamine amidotransferase
MVFTSMKITLLPLIAAIGFSLLSNSASSADAAKPLRVLLVTGGCCHDYKTQKDILKAGLEKRANIEVVQLHTDDSSTKASFPEFQKPDWAKGYDVVIHDECSADVKELPYVENVLLAHRNGTPAVNLHCAMHSYRTGTPIWFEFIGVHSTGHGPQLPIAITYEKKNHPIIKGLTDWTTGKEELYNNVKIFDGTTVLARGKQGEGDKEGQNNAAIAWVSEYGPQKTRVFSTTLAHNNETVGDHRYLDLVIRGTLWAAGKLTDEGKPAEGYAK